MITGKTAIRLLIVEDDEDDFVLASDLLSRAAPLKFEIDWAETPAKARACFSENRHDLCLMDYRLGAELGINLVRQALDQGFTAPIIMLTGQEDADVEIAAAEAGAVDYLTKDHLAKEQVMRAVRYALARREIQSERDKRMQAQAANKSKTEFLATLSHEIRTPLTSIIGYTELLMQQYRNNNQEMLEKLAVINRNGAHLLNLLNDTLDLSKIEAGKFEIDIVALELAPFVSDVAGLVQDVIMAKNLSFELLVQTPLPAIIHTDPMRLRQILLNLLGNAIKFTNTGKIQLGISCHTNENSNQLIFQVIDTGIGIHSSTLQNIFDPFIQIQAGSLNGSGLGLTISQKLATKLGGSISAESVIDAGSTFTLVIDPGQIDISKPALLILDENPRSALPSLTHQIKGKILVVDDVADIRNLIHGMLAVAGIQADIASSGQEALARLGNNTSPYVAILMDLNMPGLDGYQSLQQVHANHPDLPVIALTAANLKGERERCKTAGFADFLPKPVTASALLSTLDSVLQDQNKTTTPETDLGKSILVIEDNQDANAALCLLLELLGHRPLGVSNADAAIKAFCAAPTELVFSDLNLPDGNGLQLLERMHAINNTCRFYLISGDSSLTDSELASFISGFLLKPVNLKQLQTLLSHI